MSKEKNLRNWLILNQLHGLSRQERTFLISQLNMLESLLRDRLMCLKQEGFSDRSIEILKHVNFEVIDREMTWAQQVDHHIITFEDSSYPKLLREISSAPPILFVLGDLKILNQPQLAIVGSRKPTVLGREIAQEFSKQLSAAGFVITSGLALGIDGESHQGALKKGKTIAVLGNSIDRIYPSSHRRLAERIKENGALISEFSFGAPLQKSNFPRRNRIISGLSHGVLVIEATIRSGSLITAKFALEQNRDLFAIPGSIRNLLSQGCHKLIKQGAKLVESTIDIIEEYNFLNLENSVKCVKQKEPLSSDEKKLLSNIGFEITSIDIIMIRTGLSVQEISTMLLLLELKGYVKSGVGGYYKL